MTDPISDMLSRIKNGYMARLKSVSIPHSNVKVAIAEKLRQMGYIGKIDQNTAEKSLLVQLNYVDEAPALTDVKRMSSPGRRMYVKAKDLQKIKQRLGYVILTTPKGIKTHREALKENLGGELICAVW